MESIIIWPDPQSSFSSISSSPCDNRSAPFPCRFSFLWLQFIPCLSRKRLPRTRASTQNIVYQAKTATAFRSSKHPSVSIGRPKQSSSTTDSHIVRQYSPMPLIITSLFQVIKYFQTAVFTSSSARWWGWKPAAFKHSIISTEPTVVLVKIDEKLQSGSAEPAPGRSLKPPKIQIDHYLAWEIPIHHSDSLALLSVWGLVRALEDVIFPPLLHPR